MDGVLKLIDEYKIFNYLIPGVLGIFLIGDGALFNYVQGLDLFVSFFIYYFAGFICSRLGSLIIEPLLKKIGVVHFAKYASFLVATKKDKKIELLSQENNAYRTYIAALAIILAINSTERVFGDKIISVRESTSFLVGIFLLLILMILSYRKQTSYITKRLQYSSKRSS